MSRDARKLVLWSSDQVLHKPACTVTEACYKLEISDFKEKEGLYYPFSENKGADQLGSCCTSDLGVLFSPMQIVGCLM